jgi:putative addiction module killer protein
VGYSDSMLRDVVFYKPMDGIEPFFKFLNGLRDDKSKGRIIDRVDRARYGNFGKHKGVGSGVFELIIDFGPGYRVYYAFDGQKFIVILAGSDKADQREQIRNAKDYYLDYKARK